MMPLEPKMVCDRLRKHPTKDSGGIMTSPILIRRSSHAVMNGRREDDHIATGRYSHAQWERPSGRLTTELRAARAVFVDA